MQLHPRHTLALSAIALCGLAVGWSARRAVTPAAKVLQKAAPAASKVPKKPATWTAPAQTRDTFPNGHTVELFASSEPGEVIVRFPTDEAYNAFLYSLGSGRTRIVDALDPLRAARLAYDEWSDFVSLLDGEDVGSFESLAAVPNPTPVRSTEDGPVGFGSSLLPWLGVNGDNSAWGTGVKIAVLDTGVVPHPALPNVEESIEITPFPNDITTTYGHGTAVASLIAGHDASTPGIAPGAEIISIRIGDDTGRSDAFALAAGILAGVDSGAEILNISMGTPEDNPLIEEAIAYAHDHGVVVVAASGNSKGNTALYPAAYAGVISVGAIDARGEHLASSNRDRALSLTAPGFGIDAAWPGLGTAQVSGTSVSAPIVAGAIAATMSNGQGVTMSSSEAAEIVMENADDAGAPGPDAEYGVGILDIGRIMSRGIGGIVDVAVASQRLVPRSDGRDEIQITIQNRGTTLLQDVRIETSCRLGAREFHASNLAAGAVQTFSMPVRMEALPTGGELEVTTRATLPAWQQDVAPRNNLRVDLFAR